MLSMFAHCSSISHFLWNYGRKRITVNFIVRSLILHLDFVVGLKPVDRSSLFRKMNGFSMFVQGKCENARRFSMELFA